MTQDEQIAALREALADMCGWSSEQIDQAILAYSERQALAATEPEAAGTKEKA